MIEKQELDLNPLEAAIGKAIDSLSEDFKKTNGDPQKTRNLINMIFQDPRVNMAMKANLDEWILHNRASQY